jgi:hypothetical protein
MEDKFMDYGLKSLLGIGIPAGLNPHLFGPIRVLEKTLAVLGTICHPRSQIGIWFIADPLDLRTLEALLFEPTDS